MINMEFTTYRLQDICKVKSGKRLPAGSDFSNDVTPYPYIRARDIKKGLISSDSLAYISEELHEKLKRYVINEGDIALTIVANIGDVGYCEKELDGVNLTENAVRLTKFKKGIDTRYLTYYLSQPFAKSYMEGLAAGAAQAKLGIYKVNKIKVTLPDLNTQQAINKLISNYDKLIDNNKKTIKLLEKTTEAIYREWFIRHRFPGYKNVRFVNGVPEGWEYKKFSDVCSYIRGLSYSSEQIDSLDAPYLLINLKNLRDYGGFRKENFKTYDGDFKKEQVVNKHDLVMAVTEMVQERRIIGYVGLVPTYSQKCVLSADLIKIKSNMDNLFLYSLFIYGGVSLCFSQYGNGTNVIHLKPTSLRNIKLLIPTQDLIDKYVESVRDYFELIDQLQLENENLTIQRDSLLPRLMSGKLSVEGKEIV